MARCFHMELVVSFLQPSAKYILQSGMKSAVAFEAEGGHPNSLRRRMRFNPVLVSRISRLRCRSNHKLANQITDDADSYGAASISNQHKFIDKVSVMLGYSQLDDFVNRTQREDGLVSGSVDNFDASAICKKFPSITLGSSSEVELFNKSFWDHQITKYSSAVKCNDSQLNLSDGEWIAPENLTESRSSHDPGLLNVYSPTVREKVSWNSPFDYQNKYPADQHVRVSAPEESFASMVLEYNTLVELFLNKPICCIEGLSKKHCRQLEDCEFHTLRKLLHHFPRTYADLHNCHMGIEDGQYFIFVGKIMLLELQARGKVYIVYPIIEQSEQLPQLRAASGDYDAMCSRFPSFRCGLLHRRMKGDGKEKALKQFRDGETHILLATQVIEIGVNVPDASMMVVMNAERFGIAQLHQLRGRVGRGSKKSKCIFVASTATSVARLNVLEHSSDGFHLAKVDLLLRGPGDLLGKKQSGHLPEFPIARFELDGSIIQDAHVAALRLLSASHDLEKYPLLKAELSMRRRLSLLGD